MAAAATPSVQETLMEAPWRRNLAFVWIGVFVGLMGANFVFPFMPFYIKELGVEDKGDIALWTGWATSATGASLFLTAPLWGALSDRVGRKPMFVRALIGAGVVITLIGLVQSPWQLVGLRFLMGLFSGTVGAASALIAATTPKARVGGALGILQTGQFSANMLGPIIGGTVAESLGIRESFYFCGALFILAAVLVYIFVREDRQAVLLAAPGRHGNSGNFFSNLKAVVSERQILIMLGLLYALWLSTSFVRPLMPISIDEFSEASADQEHVTLHLSFTTVELGEKRASSFVTASLGLTATIAALTLGPLARRVGYKRTVTVAAMCTSLFFIPVALADSYGWFLIFVAMVGLTQGAMVPSMNALIASATPDGKHGSAFGLASSMQSLALMTGPLVASAIVSRWGIRWDYATISGVLMIASLVAIAYLKEPKEAIEARAANRARRAAGRGA
ncbi:MAG: MFS transporter [Dehalococcoidia bacterium]